MSSERIRATVRPGLGAVGRVTFVLVAIAGEVIGGQYANSAVPAWAERVFLLAWPQPLRVVWWLAVAAVAFGYRVILHHIGIRQRRRVVAVSVLPFVIFAGGVATGADRSTWH